jgi:hypothetical protein
MIVEEYVLDQADYTWGDSRRPERIGKGFLLRVFGDAPGRPSYTLSTQPEGFVNPAHFHNKPQFQVIWNGSVRFPTHELASIAVHYTDASFPYGPFVVGSNLLLGVYRPRIANQIYMSDREGRRQRNPYGREFSGAADPRQFFGQSSDGAWERAVDAQRLVLIDAGQCGPGAELVRYEPGALVHRAPAPFGEFVVVADGEAHLGAARLGRYSARWTRGDTASELLHAGPDGLTVLALTYDAAAEPFYTDDAVMAAGRPAP